MALAVALAEYQLSLDIEEPVGVAEDVLQYHPTLTTKPVLALDLCASPTSSSSSSDCSSSLGKAHSIASSTSSGRSCRSERPNEHLAVLLPKSLWKPDSTADTCDNFHCRTPFSLLQRRHHCRKCGGVFCASCTSRRTSLLDTSRLSFLHPPKNRPVSDFETPQSPVLDCRVCDDCWDLVWGRGASARSSSQERPMERSKSTGMLPNLIPSSSFLSSAASTSSSTSSPDSSVVLPPSLPPLALHPKPRSLRSSTPTRRSSLTSSTYSHNPSSPSSSERSYGALDAYPLRRRSLICKATGGGRWEPRTSDPPFADYRLAMGGGKTRFEVVLDKEEEEEEGMRRRREEGGVVVDGEFRYRFVVKDELPNAVVY
ncbi:FYVE zinc finger-domain-containing protein [Flagelloscypha sp. PMI_526]|nr:FYVE zinc finger-domain-containing protein [Flagelloscypha sp. PMI_526]KAH8822509.1 FYVE zinc finger-domain-containing protein [Flagelloscypha sp. PMI_526]